jgi:ERCC4-related helicase
MVTYDRSLEECSEILKRLDTLIGVTLADITNDPYVVSLRKRTDPKGRDKLRKILESGKTYCRIQLISLHQRTIVIHSELGSWAADVFVATCVERFIDGLSAKSNDDIFAEWDDSEKLYLTQFLSQLKLEKTRRWGSEPDMLSQKAELLIKAIAESYNPGCRVIIFAEQRTTVIMLSHLLSVHPLMAGIVTGHFLGTSNYANRKSSITELSAPRDQKDTINDLRTGKKSVLVTTSVLEEGIDVPGCNIVICFDPPKELRSFIQRRGRARDRHSKLLLFLESSDVDGRTKWITMEEGLKSIYSGNTRLLEDIEMKEKFEEDSEEFFRIPTTEFVIKLS